MKTPAKTTQKAVVAKDQPKSGSPRPNWVEIGTLAVAAATLIVSGVAASFSWRLHDVERQLLAFQARSEVLHKLVVVEQEHVCQLTLKYRVQLNAIWNSIARGCDDPGWWGKNMKDGNVAGLILEQRAANDAVFLPRVSLSVTTQPNTAGQVIHEVGRVGVPEVQDLGFLEEGMEGNIFLPLAVVSLDGIVISDKVFRPTSVGWSSPVTQDLFNIELGWFASPDRWQRFDWLLVAQ